MIFSAEDLFSDGQVLTATGGSMNYYDLGAHGTPLGGNALDYHNFTSIPIWVSNDVAATGTGPTCTVTVGRRLRVWLYHGSQSGLHAGH